MTRKVKTPKDLNLDLEIVSEKLKKLEEKISEKDEHLKQMEITIREKSEKNDELEKILAGNYPNKVVQFCCKECGKRFSSKTDLTSHSTSTRIVLLRRLKSMSIRYN